MSDSRASRSSDSVLFNDSDEPILSGSFTKSMLRGYKMEQQTHLTLKIMYLFY